MTKHQPLFVPRLMRISDAAGYLGISPSKLRGLPIPRKVDGGNRLYERADLDAYADSLEYENAIGVGVGDENGAVKKCDEIFEQGSA